MAERKKIGANDTHFVVQALKIRNTVSLIAIEYESRWVSVIHQVKRGDIEDFISRLHNRIINGVASLCRDSRMITQKNLEKSIAMYLEDQRGVCFYLRSDRSCNSHIAQTARQYKELIKIAGYPPVEELGLVFDMTENETIRSVNGSKDYFYPTGVMLANYLKKYMIFSADKIEQVIKAIHDKTLSGPDFPDLRVLH